MTWLIWRQHRGGILGAAVVLAVLGALLLLHGVPMHEAYARDAIDTRHLRPFEVDPGSCAQMVLSFESRWSTCRTSSPRWLPFLPMLAGMLIGAPLLAREFEAGHLAAGLDPGRDPPPVAGRQVRLRDRRRRARCRSYSPPA